MHQNEIVLVRGLPGSGKTTLAMTMTQHVHLEADKFLEVNGVYRYDPAKVRGAHDSCVASAKNHLAAGRSVVIANTLMKRWEVERYIDLGYPYRIIETKGSWPNVHGVQENKIADMKNRWESVLPAWLPYTTVLSQEQLVAQGAR